MENLERFFSFFLDFGLKIETAKYSQMKKLKQLGNKTIIFLIEIIFFIFVNNNLFFNWRYMILVINPFKLNNSFNCKTICLKEHKIIMK